MLQPTFDRLIKLLATHKSPCISLYQPTHRQHPENKQDPIRYRNMLGKLEASLRTEHSARVVRALLEKFQELARDEQFWNHRTTGLAIFGSPETFEFFELQRPVRELLVVADSFHTKPLIRVLQSADRYHILCLNRHEAQLFEGNRDALESVELVNVTSKIKDVLGDNRSPTTQMVGSYGTKPARGGSAFHHGHGPQTDPTEADLLRFFRTVDRGLLEHHSRPTGLPMLLAALPEYHEPFRRVSHNPFLLPAGITMNPAALSVNQLRDQAWKAIEPFYLARLKELKDGFLTARSMQAGSADLSDIAKAAVAGQVATLLVEADRVIPGEIERSTGAIRSGESANPNVDDMIDDIAELVLAKGGKVVVVPTERMPVDSGLAAVFRF